MDEDTRSDSHPTLDQPLRGRVALITGGGRGLGAAVARLLAGAGAAVAISDIDADPAEALATELRGVGLSARAWQHDVTSASSGQQVVAEVAEIFGPIDILVTCAGIASEGKSLAVSRPQEVERLFAVHVMGSLHITQAVLPGMRDLQRGDLIYFSSVAVQRLEPKSGPYVMAKAAVEAMSRTLAGEESRHHIRSNIIAPKLFDSRLAREISQRIQSRNSARGVSADIPPPEDPKILAAAVLEIVTNPDPGATARRVTVGGPGDIIID